MKFLTICLLTLLPGITHAQKRFDCLVNVIRDSPNTRIAGRLIKVDDSAITVQSKGHDTILYYDNITRIRFRKHHGFQKTSLPIILGGAAAVVCIAAAVEKPTSYHPGVGILAVGLYSIAIAIPASIIYLTTRDKIFEIHSFTDFLNIKPAIKKYIWH